MVNEMVVSWFLKKFGRNVDVDVHRILLEYDFFVNGKLGKNKNNIYIYIQRNELLCKDYLPYL